MLPLDADRWPPRLQMIRKPTWREQGEDPDYRFSLANERTFLAWIRTAIALLAGAVLLKHAIPPLHSRLVLFAALLLILMACVFSQTAYLRWRENEVAMRLKMPLPHSRALLLAALLVMLCSLCLLALLVVS